MRELLERQLLDARGGVADGPLDIAAFADAVARTYETLDRERRLAAENAAEKTRELESATVQLRAESAEKIAQPESLACGNIIWRWWPRSGCSSTCFSGRPGRIGGGACR